MTLLGNIAKKVSALLGGASPSTAVCRVKELDATTVDFSGYIQELLNKQNDCLIVRGVLDKQLLREATPSIPQKIQGGGQSINMEDGSVYPAPYSMVHNNNHHPEQVLEGYFTQAQQAQTVNPQLFGNDLLNSMQGCLARLLGGKAKLLQYADGRPFSVINTRVLFAQKSGIDIHCENAFLSQLYPAFREELYRQVDIENAISYFFVLQAPDEGGELVAFDKVWDHVPIQLSGISYEARHDIGGSMFVAAKAGKARHQMIAPQAGDLVVFRAAQIWHSINALKGNTARITAGGFFAKATNGNGIYYWA